MRATSTGTTSTGKLTWPRYHLDCHLHQAEEPEWWKAMSTTHRLETPGHVGGEIWCRGYYSEETLEQLRAHHGDDRHRCVRACSCASA